VPVIEQPTRKPRRSAADPVSPLTSQIASTRPDAPSSDWPTTVRAAVADARAFLVPNPAPPKTSSLEELWSVRTIRMAVLAEYDSGMVA